MNNFIRYCNQNRKKIGGIIIIIAFLFIIFYQLVGNRKTNQSKDNNIEINLNENTSTLKTA